LNGFIFILAVAFISFSAVALLNIKDNMEILKIIEGDKKK